MISSYVGENAEFERQYLSGELEVELTPQVNNFDVICSIFCGMAAAEVSILLAVSLRIFIDLKGTRDHLES